MTKLVPVLLMSLAMGGAYAQDTGGGVTMSTDPAKAAAVESHAQELKAQQAKPMHSTSATHKSGAKTHASGKSHASSGKSHTTAKSHATHKTSATKSTKS